jgi:uncharacterized protein YjiS (DUF1127 family)
MSTLAIAADTIGLHTVASWFKRLEVYFAAKSMQRSTVKELSNLSDRELHDIGMHRGMIAYAGKEAYRMTMDGRVV